MRRSDDLTTSTVHSFNLLQGIYIYRNRLAHWSNPGVLPGQLPPSEQLNKALSAVKLYSNTVSSMKSSFLIFLSDADARYFAARHPGFSRGGEGRPPRHTSSEAVPRYFELSSGKPEHNCAVDLTAT